MLYISFLEVYSNRKNPRSDFFQIKFQRNLIMLIPAEFALFTVRDQLHPELPVMLRQQKRHSQERHSMLRYTSAR